MSPRPVASAASLQGPLNRVAPVGTQPRPCICAIGLKHPFQEIGQSLDRCHLTAHVPLREDLPLHLRAFFRFQLSQGVGRDPRIVQGIRARPVAPVVVRRAHARPSMPSRASRWMSLAMRSRSARIARWINQDTWPMGFSVTAPISP